AAGRTLLLHPGAAARRDADPLRPPRDPAGIYLSTRNRILLARRHGGAWSRRLHYWPRLLAAEVATGAALGLAPGGRSRARALLRGVKDGLQPGRPRGFKEFLPEVHHVPRPVLRPARTGEGAGLPALPAMLARMEAAPAVVRPSAYWTFLNGLNLDQLAESGFAEFKRTINQNYFNFLPAGPGSDQFRAALRLWLARPTGPVLRARVQDPGYFEDHTWRDNPFRSLRRRAGYAAFVAMLWEVAARRDSRGLLARLEEPDLGHPLCVLHRGRRITQDLCNSVLEVTAMLDGLPGGAVGGNGVLELGAGYGRVAWVFLEAFPDLRYFVVDIPPALAVAQEYLTRLFPRRPAFRFRPFRRFEDVRSEMEDARIGFLTPDQLDLVPPWGAGLFVNISSLHEMRPDQIAHYVGKVGEHTAGFFYTKQWERSVNAYDRVVIRREDYPIPAHWETVFLRPHPVQTLFFEALYRVRPAPRA
ncbi:MAG: putative sugar O-methyltransferase, partial [Planctomycetes bacterium]|nr:putative sugar O-methyltransferase [Planctomycetota bacterium]